MVYLRLWYVPKQIRFEETLLMEKVQSNPSPFVCHKNIINSQYSIFRFHLSKFKNIPDAFIKVFEGQPIFWIRKFQKISSISNLVE